MEDGESGSGSFLKNNWRAGFLLATWSLCCGVLVAAGLNADQATASAVVAFGMLGSGVYLQHRLWFAFTSVVTLVLLGYADVFGLVTGDDYAIVLFLGAMMVLVGHLEESHVFSWAMSSLLTRLGPRPRLLISALAAFAAVSAALVDEATSTLIVVNGLLALLASTGVNPVPFALLIVFASNVGSAATVVGNPDCLILAVRLDLTALDFIANAAPVCLVALLGCLAVGLVALRKPFRELERSLNGAWVGRLQRFGLDGPRTANFRQSLWLFGSVLTAIAAHHPLEELLALPTNTLLVLAAVVGAAVALKANRDPRQLLRRSVDLKSLLFFLMLFAMVEALERVAVTSVLADRLTDVVVAAGGSADAFTVAFTLAAGAPSAVVNNVFGVTLFAPVIQRVLEQGQASEAIVWATLLGSTFFGNLTPVGGVANLLVVSHLERRGERVSTRRWVLYGLPVTGATTLITLLMLT